MQYKKFWPFLAIIVIIGTVMLTSGLNKDSGYGDEEYAVSNSLAMAPQAAMLKSGSSDFGLAEVESGRMMADSLPIEPPGNGGVIAPEVTDRLIIRNGSLSVVVADVRAAATSLQSLANATGGFVVSSNINEYNKNAPTAHVTLRIPSEGLDSAIDSVRTLGTIESENVSGRDVTEEFVDITAQLENLKVTEEQFQTIMKRATEITDVLAVQRELSNVRQQIERLEGRKKYLTESAAFSMLTINLATDPGELPVVDGDDWRPRVVALDALRSLAVVGQDLLSAIIWFFVYSPVWIVGLIIFWIIRRRMIRSGK
jgi:hypothetical protein